MLRNYSPLIQTLLGTGLTWAVTALGAAFCAFQTSKTGTRKQVMLAASFWSLLDPAIVIAKNELRMGVFSVVPATMGLVVGAAFVGLAAHFLPAEVGVYVSVFVHARFRALLCSLRRKRYLSNRKYD
ncbi:unnamed protein product [Echinostoma caproni]|uniref:Spermidine Putrescine ABC transporter permease component PotB n=1 Tax=Echinostoma caproni TaxID=27848 RepID=A0A183B2Y2_9TREM|nr:unnamed protein product [Echinostoma caproni]